MTYWFGLLAVVATVAGGAELRVGKLLDAFGSADPAVCVAVVDGTSQMTGCRGLAEVEIGAQATAKTNFRLASVTKQFTATAVLLLVKDGKLRLDETVEEALPGVFPASYAKTITVRHLLTHTSGLWDYEDLIPQSVKGQFKDAEAVKFSASHDTLYFAPGSKFQYSNTGYAALAEIVARASGMRFGEFLKKRIFEPLGMKDSVAHEEGITVVRNRAYGYWPEPGGGGKNYKRRDQSQTSAVLGDGGIYASLEDLLRWNEALDSARLLPRALLDESTRVTALTTGEPLRYGFGWFVEEHRGVARNWHSGETSGFRNAYQRFPGRKLAVIVLSNRNDLDARKLSLEIADLYLQ